jgi:hypothetical protein
MNILIVLPQKEVGLLLISTIFYLANRSSYRIDNELNQNN